MPHRSATVTEILQGKKGSVKNAPFPPGFRVGLLSAI